MKQLSKRGYLWLKGIHVVFAALWAGSTLCILLLIFLNRYLFNSTGDTTYSINIAIKIIDIGITAMSALGCTITGLIFSLKTKWGFFKHLWITVKWILTLFSMSLGGTWIRSLIDNLIKISAENTLSSIQSPIYTSNMRALIITFSIIVFIPIFTLIISVVKPWGQKQGAAIN